MNWIELDTYIPPIIRLINLISKLVHIQLKLHIWWAVYWVEQSQDLMLKSFVYFSSSHIRVLSCLSIIFSSCIFHGYFYSSPFTRRILGIYLFIYLFCNWHSLNTNYFGTIFGGVAVSFNSYQIECMCNQNRPLFKVRATEQYSTSPLLKGITQKEQQKSFFLLL